MSVSQKNYIINLEENSMTTQDKLNIKLLQKIDFLEKKLDNLFDVSKLLSKQTNILHQRLLLTDKVVEQLEKELDLLTYGD